MAKTIIDLSGMGGLSPRHYGERLSSSANPQYKIIGKDNMIADGVCNPLRVLGYMGPANNTTVNVANATNAIAANIGCTQLDTINSKIYFAERATRIHEIDAYTDDTSLDSLRAVTGATMVDLEIYQVNGVRRFFYAYQKAGGGNIGHWDFASTFDDTYLSATASGGFTLAAAVENKMIVADNGFMYILDGTDVHKFDGTANGGSAGTATQDVLVFPVNFQLIDGIDLRGKLWLTLIKTTRNFFNQLKNTAVSNEFCGVYIWDRKSSVVDFTDFIPIEGIKEIRTIFQFRGAPWIFTVSAENFTQIRTWDGGQFKVIKELGSEAYPQFKDSVQIVSDMFYWQGNDGLVYAYGKITPEIEGDGLWKIGDMNNHVAATKTFQRGGAMAIAGGADNSISNTSFTTKFWLAFEDNNSTTQYLLKTFYPHAVTPGASQSPEQGDIFSMVKVLPKGSTVKSITIVYPQTATTSTTTEITVKIYFNQSTTAWGSATITRTDGTRGYKFIQVGEPNVYAVQIELEWNIDLILAIDMIFPLYAIVEYEETDRKL